ncbi:hypothetical protein C9I57_27720 [Trinickia symbiotica]|uniref:Uncharacterized protein n=2 Tax=Trinickia symbiotica TaxID=863227 RepID=A0A2T3XLT3_9BURK|nr:hypothetical protein C9I57_27720 [Trinickia symbiotica]
MPCGIYCDWPLQGVALKPLQLLLHVGLTGQDGTVGFKVFYHPYDLDPDGKGIQESCRVIVTYPPEGEDTGKAQAYAQQSKHLP